MTTIVVRVTTRLPDRLDLSGFTEGQRFRFLRRWLGMKVATIAREWERSESYVYKVERDEQEATNLELRWFVEQLNEAMARELQAGQ